ncbi:MAG: AsmA-like C-terminal region-containing protein, partial [Syntrophorhabdales bacterium]
MKKALVILLIVLAVVCGTMIAAWYTLPMVASHLLSKAIGGTVDASQSSVTLKGRLLVVKLSGVRMKGRVEGTVGTAELRLEPAKGLYIKYFTISDFRVKIGKESGHLAFFPVPVELAEIRRGTVDYGGRTYVLREMRVKNFNTGGQLEFTIDGGVEGWGDLKTKGGGYFGERRSDIKGEYRLFGVNMARVFKDYEGLADSRGTFTYRSGRLIMDGRVEAPYFSLMEKFLTRRLVSLGNVCRIHLERAGVMTDVTLTGLSFHDTPLDMKFSSAQRKLVFLELKTGFLAIPDLLDYLNPALLSEGDWGPLFFVKKGDMRIDRFVFQRGSPLTARIDVRRVEVGSGAIAFHDVSGSLRLDGNALALSGFEAGYGEGRVSEVSGLVPLKLDRDVRVSGRFSVALRDLSRLAPTVGLEVVSGTTEGDMELSGRKDRGFTVKGAGIVHDGRFVWNRIAVGASGGYTFKDGAVTFAPLVVGEAGTRLVVRGSAGMDRADLRVSGVADGEQIRQLFASRYTMKGPVGVEGEVGLEKGALRLEGRLAMTDLSLEIPHIMKKESGIESTALVSLTRERGGDIRIDRLSCTLGPLKGALSAWIGKGRARDVHLILDAPDLKRASGLFFFDRGEAEGGLKADLRIDDLPYPVVRLPAIRGYLTLQRGVLHPPALRRPLTDIDLACSFEKERFVIDLGGLRSGTSRVIHGRLEVKGLDAPVFALAVDMDNFDPADFAGQYGKRFTVPVIDARSLMARTTGVFRLTSKALQIRRMVGHECVLSGTVGDRTVTVTQGRLRMGKGELIFRGNTHLASPPVVSMTGQLRDVTAQEVLALFGGKQDIFEGTGSLSADLVFTGRDSHALAGSASGTVSISSGNGVLRRWNVLSKILALTNVYDLFRGQVDLTREGLVYRRLSASFQGKDGVFHTDDFLIDSPSMLITGSGDLDLGRREIDGRMTV